MNFIIKLMLLYYYHYNYLSYYIGLNIFSDLITEAMNSTETLATLISENFFHKKKNQKYLIANAILVDMESKVIEKCLTTAPKNNFTYDIKYIVKKQSGSGNNWANGFFNHGPSIEQDFLEKLTALINAIFTVDSILVINSLAGGTGSGLGAYINVIVKENFPHLNLIVINIWPSSTGEVIVNSYNTLLSIAESYISADLMIVFENDDVFEICGKVLKIKKIHFEHFNSVIAKRLLAILVPVIDCNSNSDSTYLSLSGYFKSLVSRLTKILSLDTKTKLCKIVVVPEIPDDQVKFTNNSWSALIKTAESQVEKIKSLAIIFRGRRNISDVPEKDFLIESVVNNLNSDWPEDYSINKSNYQEENSNNMKNMSIVNDYNGLFDFGIINKNNDSKCNYFNKNFEIIKGTHNFRNNEKHLTLIVNSGFLSNNLESFIDKGCQMLDLNVFTHHYYKYGLEYDDFINAFRVCSQIVHDYK